MEEIKEVLTDEEYDEVIDNYSRCINNWTGDDYFIGITISDDDDDDENLIDFKRFFNEHNLWKFIDWEPELLLINFCF